MQTNSAASSGRTLSNPQLCFICDDGYAMYTGVAITSIIINCQPTTVYDIYIITSALSEENIALLKRNECACCRIHIVKVNEPQKYKNLKIEGFPVTTTALFKFDLPRLFPKLSKMLYLDGDLIVQGDLSELFNTDITDLYAAVVKDHRALTLKGDMNQRLAITHEAYFNSGVMLLNLDRMRAHSIPEKLLDYRKNGINHYMDQDALNVVFQEQVRYLSFFNNFQMTCWRNADVETLASYYQLPPVNDPYEWLTHATIVHYTAEKPWQYYDGKCSEIWLHYYLRSAYKHQMLQRASILTRCKTEADVKRIHQSRYFSPAASPVRLMEKPLVSVIMPVYNAEKFLYRAMFSLLSQTLVDFEVICVNDCSTDGSLDVLNRYASVDPRFRIIASPKNQGAGASRNIGMDAARGEYIVFLDSDDRLLENALEQYYLTAVSTKADVVISKTSINGRVTSTSLKTEHLPGKHVFSPDEVKEVLFSISHGGPGGKCMRTQFIREQQLRYLEIARSEDFFFIQGAMAVASTIACIEAPLYYIVHDANPQSLEHTKDATPAIFWEAVMLFKQWLVDRGLYEPYKRSFINANLERFTHNISMLNSAESFRVVHDKLQSDIVRELELNDHDEEYFYESQKYKKVMQFFSEPIEQTIAAWEKAQAIKRKAQPAAKAQAPALNPVQRVIKKARTALYLFKTGGWESITTVIKEKQGK